MSKCKSCNSEMPKSRFLFVSPYCEDCHKKVRTDINPKSKTLAAKKVRTKSNMKSCMCCRKNKVRSKNHDLCYSCYTKQKGSDNEKNNCDHFEENKTSKEIHTVYIMFYGDKEKVGYTKDLNSRIIEIKRKFPDNKLVYFREFPNQTEAKDFELWLKKLKNRHLTRFISDFQDKIKKVEML
jgi:predicted GIY-YIG superfamily endonuclease